MAVHVPVTEQCCGHGGSGSSGSRSSVMALSDVVGCYVSDTRRVPCMATLIVAGGTTYMGGNCGG
jgi:hypothetical protein